MPDGVCLPRDTLALIGLFFSNALQSGDRQVKISAVTFSLMLSLGFCWAQANPSLVVYHPAPAYGQSWIPGSIDTQKVLLKRDADGCFCFLFYNSGIALFSDELETDWS